MNYSDKDTKERCVQLALYIIEEKTTVRQAAGRFGVSKSTVHKDVTERLEKINPCLYRQVEDVLLQNKRERHLRGGEATNKNTCIRKNSEKTNKKPKGFDEPDIL